MPFVGGVGGFVAVTLARHNHPDGRLPVLHDPGLHWRGVSPKQHRFFAGGVFVVHPEGVPHIARRVPLGDVQHLKVVMVPLNLRAFHHAKPHGHKCVANLTDDLCSGV